MQELFLKTFTFFEKKSFFSVTALWRWGYSVLILKINDVPGESNIKAKKMERVTGIEPATITLAT